MRKFHLFLFAVTLSFCFGIATSSQAQQSSTAGIHRVVVRRVEPRYPELAKKMNLGGTVKVVAVVAPDGKVTKVEPVGGSPLLVQAAQSAISQWKFTAGPESQETIELHFTP